MAGILFPSLLFLSLLSSSHLSRVHCVVSSSDHRLRLLDFVRQYPDYAARLLFDRSSVLNRSLPPTGSSEHSAVDQFLLGSEVAKYLPPGTAVPPGTAEVGADGREKNDDLLSSVGSYADTPTHRAATSLHFHRHTAPSLAGSYRRPARQVVRSAPSECTDIYRDAAEVATLKHMNLYRHLGFIDKGYQVQFAERILGVVSHKFLQLVLDQIAVWEKDTFRGAREVFALPEISGADADGKGGGLNEQSCARLYHVLGGLGEARLEFSSGILDFLDGLADVFETALRQSESQYRNTPSKLGLFQGFGAWVRGITARTAEKSDSDPLTQSLFFDKALRKLDALFVGVNMLLIVISREGSRVPGMSPWAQTGTVHFYDFLLRLVGDRPSSRGERKTSDQIFRAEFDVREREALEAARAEMDMARAAGDMHQETVPQFAQRIGKDAKRSFAKTRAAVVTELRTGLGLEEGGGGGREEAGGAVPAGRGERAQTDEVNPWELWTTTNKKESHGPAGADPALFADLSLQLTLALTPPQRGDCEVCRTEQRRQQLFYGNNKHVTIRGNVVETTPFVDSTGDWVFGQHSADDLMKALDVLGNDVLGSRVGYNFWSMKSEVQYNSEPCDLNGPDWDLCYVTQGNHISAVAEDQNLRLLLSKNVLSGAFSTRRC